MAKSLMLAAFLVCISCAFADSTSMTVSATPMATPVQSSSLSPFPQPSYSATSSATSTSATHSPPPMMTTPSPMSSPMPSPTPGPSPPPPDRSYIYPRNGPVCIHLEAGITTSVTYETANGTNTAVFVVNGTAAVDQANSMCNATYAELVLIWGSNNLTFAFSATNTTWTEEGVTFGYKITPDSLPNYTGHYSSGVATFDTSSNDGLLMGRNNSVDQSFLCNTSQTFNAKDTNTGNTTNATMTVRDLRMQAFYFTNSSTGDFDAAFECPTDNESTNKIVPIVVGAALAGLVIVVLIAYLIGRFRNRKQSSYEALS